MAFPNAANEARRPAVARCGLMKGTGGVRSAGGGRFRLGDMPATASRRRSARHKKTQGGGGLAIEHHRNPPRSTCLLSAEREFPALLLVVWGYQQNQLIFGTGVFFSRVSAKFFLGVFSAFWGCFCAFLGCFCVFGGCFCGFGVFFFFFSRASANFFCWGVVNFFGGGTTPKRGIPALSVRVVGCAAAGLGVCSGLLLLLLLLLF